MQGTSAPGTSREKKKTAALASGMSRRRLADGHTVTFIEFAEVNYHNPDRNASLCRRQSQREPMPAARKHFVPWRPPPLAAAPHLPAPPPPAVLPWTTPPQPLPPPWPAIADVSHPRLSEWEIEGRPAPAGPWPLPAQRPRRHTPQRHAHPIVPASVQPQFIGVGHALVSWTTFSQGWGQGAGETQHLQSPQRRRELAVGPALRLGKPAVHGRHQMLGRCHSLHLCLRLPARPTAIGELRQPRHASTCVRERARARRKRKGQGAKTAERQCTARSRITASSDFAVSACSRSWLASCCCKNSCRSASAAACPPRRPTARCTAASASACAASHPSAAAQGATC